MNLNEAKAAMHAPVRNYVIPGLTSWLICKPETGGIVRLFENTRDHQEQITPHSHRFDFHCQVLSGRVRNIVWVPDCMGDEFRESELLYFGDMGKYDTKPGLVRRWGMRVSDYHVGQTYSMTYDQVHSIQFAKGTTVLFHEGPTKTNATKIIEPYVDGQVIPSFEVKPWMFRREAAA